MIRPAMPEDAQQIAEFISDIRTDTVPVVHSVAAVAEWIRDVHLPRGSSFVWAEGDTILAWVDVTEGWLNQLYCRRGSTGRGIGKALVDFAKAKSPACLQLYTFQVNVGARRFYAREGFIEVSFTDGGNEEGQPDVLLEWRQNDC